MKRIKTISIDDEVYNFLCLQPNASKYLEELVRMKMNEEKK